MRRIPNQCKVDDETLVFLYRKVLQPWETRFKHQKFRMPRKQEGFKAFCIDNDILIEPLTSSRALQKNNGSFVHKSKKLNGLFRMSTASHGSRKDREDFTLPKCLLYHLRNAVAHAAFGSKRIQGIDYLYFESWFRGKLKIQAQIKVSLLDDFLNAAISTKVT